VIVGDLSIPLSPTDRSSRQKINKEILELNDIIDQMDLIDIYRIFHPTTAQYTFFSAAHGCERLYNENYKPLNKEIKGDSEYGKI
jgi:exonuclease III